MKQAFLLLVVLLLLTSCSAFRPAPHPATATVHLADSVTATILLPPAATSQPLSPRQQRCLIRTVSRAQARVARAQRPPTPLVSSVKVKHKDDNRGAAGGAYAPRAKAPVAAAGSTATQTTTSTTWLWWLLAAAAAWTIWHARTSR